MATQIQIRRGTAALWTSTNPTLAEGELGYETDTGEIKIGDGLTAWTGLTYIGLLTSSTIITALGYEPMSRGKTINEARNSAIL